MNGAESGPANGSGAGGADLPLDPRVDAWSEERRVVEPPLTTRFPGRFTGLRVLTPTRARAAEARLRLRGAPDAGAVQVSEALLGEDIGRLEDLPGGWSWVRTLRDGYLGYVRTDGLGPDGSALTVGVSVPRAQLLSAPRVSAAPLAELGLLSRITLLDPEPFQVGDYRWWRAAYRGGEAFLHQAATEPQTGLAAQASTAERLAYMTRYLDAPYLWGGRSAWGLDCSGLTGLYLTLAAPQREHPWPPRDADMQRAALAPVPRAQAGDLAFFPGHVGLMLDGRRMLHANATHMRVSIETLGEGEYGERLAAGLLGYGRVPGGGGQ